MKGIPKISVILPVYNAVAYLDQSIQSILNQDFEDFELIIIDDGSTDGSAEKIEAFSDHRIRFIKQQNAGLAATLNKGIQLSKGEFIARQDNDDISLPNRLSAQLHFLEQHPEVSLLGCRALIINENGESTGRFHDHPTGNAALKYFLLFDNPFVHSSVMFRKSVYDRAGGYNEDPKYFEDHNLWSRMARLCQLANLDERLLLYREVKSGMSKTTADYTNRVKNQSVENLRYYMRSLTEEQFSDFITLHFDTLKEINKKTIDAYKKGLSVLANDFCLVEKISFNEIAGEQRRQISRFKRKYFQALLDDPASSVWLKFITRVRRRLFFIFNSSNIT